MPIFMKYDGLDGESQVRGKVGYIELDALSWSLSRATAAAKGDARGDSQFSVTEIVVTRKQDSLSALIMQEAAFGVFDRKVEIAFVRTGANKKPAVFLSLKLTDAGISSYSLSSGGDTPMESLAISFNTITMESAKTDDNLTAVPNTAAIDVSTGARG